MEATNSSQIEDFNQNESRKDDANNEFTQSMRTFYLNRLDKTELSQEGWENMQELFSLKNNIDTSLNHQSWILSRAPVRPVWFVLCIICFSTTDN